MNWLRWAPLVAALAHRPAIHASITPRLYLLINGLPIFFCLAAGITGPTPRGVAMWLTLAALLASNPLWASMMHARRAQAWEPVRVLAWVARMGLARPRRGARRNRCGCIDDDE